MTANSQASAQNHAFSGSTNKIKALPFVKVILFYDIILKYNYIIIKICITIINVMLSIFIFC